MPLYPLPSGRLSADAPSLAPSPRQGAAARPLASGRLSITADEPARLAAPIPAAAARPEAAPRAAAGRLAAAPRPRGAARAVASGRLLLETIICLVVLGMFSMFIFQKQLAQQKQLEEVNAAGAIRTLRDAVKSAVALQRDDLVGYPEGVTLKDASEFLPQEYFSGFRVAVRREGAKLSAVIVSPTSLGRYALDNLSAARISSMLGASGGFVPSLTDEPSSIASGTLGLWSLDMASIDASLADPVRIVVQLDFPDTGNEFAEEKEKLLYRTNEYGDPSNTMLTALFFNDGTKDTIRIDPDGSFTNGAFTINPDGSITNGSFTVGANGEIAAAGGRFSVDAGGSGTFAGNLSVGGGMIINGRAFAWDHVARGGIYVEHDPRTNNWEDMKAAISMDAGGVNFHKADGTHTLSMANDSGNISSAGSIAATGTLRAAKVVVAGTACNGGQVASNGTSTLLCTGGKWADPFTSGSHGQAVFTASGSWTAPAGVTQVWVSGTGGGAGGNGGQTADEMGFSSGGAGGQFVTKRQLTVTPGTSYVITIGGAGAGAARGAYGAGGGATKFGSLLTLAGGPAGTRALYVSNGTGAGAPPDGAFQNYSRGGSTPFGIGGTYTYMDPTAGQAVNAVGYGAGGAGGVTAWTGWSSINGARGTNGGPGLLIVEW